jgi:hypothetical protein
LERKKKNVECLPDALGSIPSAEKKGKEKNLKKKKRKTPEYCHRPLEADHKVQQIAQVPEPANFSLHSPALDSEGSPLFLFPE